MEVGDRSRYRSRCRGVVRGERRGETRAGREDGAASPARRGIGNYGRRPNTSCAESRSRSSCTSCAWSCFLRCFVTSSRRSPERRPTFFSRSESGVADVDRVRAHRSDLRRAPSPSRAHLSSTSHSHHHPSRRAARRHQPRWHGGKPITGPPSPPLQRHAALRCAHFAARRQDRATRGRVKSNAQPHHAAHQAARLEAISTQHTRAGEEEAEAERVGRHVTSHRRESPRAGVEARVVADCLWRVLPSLFLPASH